MPVTQVLVVDDFLPWLRFVRVMFESRRDLNIIAVAVDGLEAVQKAQELQPDLILLDIGLPTMNGIEAARRIRRLSPNSKILFVSNEASREVAEEAIRLGAPGYLLKPDAARDLLLAVDAILRGELFVSSRLTPYVMSSADKKYPPDRSGSKEPAPRLLQKEAAYDGTALHLEGGPDHDEVQKSAHVNAPRAMEWEITRNKALYNCTRCAWKLAVEVGTCLEPFRLFEQHDCADYPSCPSPD